MLNISILSLLREISNNTLDILQNMIAAFQVWVYGLTQPEAIFYGLFSIGGAYVLVWILNEIMGTVRSLMRWLRKTLIGTAKWPTRMALSSAKESAERMKNPKNWLGTCVGIVIGSIFPITMMTIYSWNTIRGIVVVTLMIWLLTVPAFAVGMVSLSEILRRQSILRDVPGRRFRSGPQSAA